MRTFIFTCFLLISANIYAISIEGSVMDSKGNALVGVNVYLKDTYDGATTDLSGNFQFETTETGVKVLVASYIGYKSYEETVDLSSSRTISITLRDDVNRLNAVTIIAGNFDASDKNKVEVLKPLDIAMTAGATADITGALSKLPGTTINGESGRLFVRGGSSNETKAFIDGVLVPSFYSSSPNSVPTRSRFSPFLFKGTFFSTGGYSAEYGQALSSVLSLSSNDLPAQTITDISLMSVGGDIAHTQKWDNGSVYGQIQYTNLDPYNNLIKQEYNWRDGFTSTQGTFMLRQKDNKNGIFKLYSNFDRSGFAIDMPNVNAATKDQVDLQNDNIYVNGNYKFDVGKQSMGYVGLSFGDTEDQVVYNNVTIDNGFKSAHSKAYIISDISQISIKTGAELISMDIDESLVSPDGSSVKSHYKNTVYALFTESDFYISSRMTLRTGLRYSSSTFQKSNLLSPRISMAFKTGNYSKVSAAYGNFHQLPANNLLLRSNRLESEKADHYMLSYQSNRSNRVFRSEIYYKNYDHLVKFDPSDEYNPEVYTNSGRGYARGLDLFWRDAVTIPNAEYWVSYSYLDTERDFLDYTETASPTFAARHNFSIVYKHFVSALKTQMGASYSYNSGRPYNDPNKSGFNQSVTPHFSDLSFNLAYLFRQNIILYASATNLLGRENIFGYEFEDQPGTDNYYNSRAIGQPAKRFLFLGIFITLTKDNNSNNLENL